MYQWWAPPGPWLALSGRVSAFHNFESNKRLLRTLYKSYAIYLTLLRRMTDDTLNLPMFFGFVGMFIMLMFWPGLGKISYATWR